jgi:acyl dehydratase
MHEIRELIQGLHERIGEVIYESPDFTVTQRELDVFAALTENIDPMHNDVVWAAQGPWGQTIVHGLFTLGFVSMFNKEASTEIYTTEKMYALNYGFDKVRFPAPFLTNHPARCTVRLIDIIDKGAGRYIIATEFVVTQCGNAKPAMVATFLPMVVTTDY